MDDRKEGKNELTGRRREREKVVITGKRGREKGGNEMREREKEREVRERRMIDKEEWRK